MWGRLRRWVVPNELWHEQMHMLLCIVKVCCVAITDGRANVPLAVSEGDQNALDRKLELVRTVFSSMLSMELHTWHSLLTIACQVDTNCKRLASKSNSRSSLYSVSLNHGPFLIPQAIHCGVLDSSQNGRNGTGSDSTGFPFSPLVCAAGRWAGVGPVLVLVSLMSSCLLPETVSRVTLSSR